MHRDAKVRSVGPRFPIIRYSDCRLVCMLQGSAGQSFGCFMVSGMKTTVIGEANDYVGKGMAGGDIAIMPPADSGFKAEDASIVGNTCLYGATGGRLFVNGKAGWC